MKEEKGSSYGLENSGNSLPEFRRSGNSLLSSPRIYHAGFFLARPAGLQKLGISVTV
ncbi:MAG: hypothetical protein WDN09_00995 [bacterium]